MEFSSKIREVRKKENLTQEEFAEKIAGFKATLSELNKKGAQLDKEIERHLSNLQFVEKQ